MKSIAASHLSFLITFHRGRFIKSNSHGSHREWEAALTRQQGAQRATVLGPSSAPSSFGPGRWVRPVGPAARAGAAARHPRPGPGRET